MPVETTPLPELTAAQRDRFWGKVGMNFVGNCWPWLAAKDKRGYGRFMLKTSVGMRPILAPRIAWTLVYGDIPPGMYVCHKCDNPSCLNPDDLFLGTAADNNSDMRSKRRHSFGSKHYNTELFESDIEEMRMLRRTGSTLRELMERFNVSAPMVSMACSGKHWAHVDGEVSLEQSRRIARENNVAPRGLDHWNAKLNTRLVLEIRSRYDGGESVASIAKDLRVNDETARDVAKRKSWRSLKEEN